MVGTSVHTNLFPELLPYPVSNVTPKLTFTVINLLIAITGNYFLHNNLKIFAGVIIAGTATTV